MMPWTLSEVSSARVGGVVELNDGAPVSSWLDSSGNGYTATQSGSARPIFKTNIINSKPVVRFTVAGSSGLNLAASISGAAPWTVFAVMKPLTPTSILHTLASSTDNGSVSGVNNTDGRIYVLDRTTLRSAVYALNAFHVITCGSAGGGFGGIFADGTQLADANSAFASTGDFNNLGYRGFTSSYSDGDIAEMIVYSQAITTPSRDNVEKYLGNKYGIAVAGGTVIDPTTVFGLVAWWKADSLGT